jgi:hypothetical protein
MEALINLIKNPSAAILKAKRAKSYSTTLMVLVIEWLLIGIAAAIIPANLGTMGAFVGAVLGGVLFITGIICVGFFAFLLQLVMRTLGGKGNYLHGLTAITYTMFPLSLGIFILAILSLIPILGIFLGFIAMSMLAVMSMAILYRSVKELFSVDMITALIGISVLMLGLVIAFWMTAAIGTAGNLSTLMSMSGFPESLGTNFTFPAIPVS